MSVGDNGLLVQVFDAFQPLGLRHQLFLPLRVVGLGRVATRCVARESRRDDEPAARAQQLDAGLIPDLDPPAGQQRHPAGEVGGLAALAVVERRTVRTKLVVEMVDLRIVGLADIAVLGLHHFAEFGIKTRSSKGNIVTKHGVEKIIRAPKDYDAEAGA